MAFPFRLRHLALAIPLGLSLATWAIPPPAASASSPVSSHALSVRLEPATHRLEATDRIKLQGVSGGSTLRLLLHKDLVVRSVKAMPSGDTLTFVIRPGPDHRREVVDRA